MILGLIPARGGSKGIPKKNIKPFCGRPLIEYAIEVGLGCKFINWVFVSTDSDEIEGVVWECVRSLAGVVNRPSELAQNDTPMMPVIQHAVKTVEEHVEKDSIDAVVLIDPTNPLRTVEDVEGAWKLFNEPGTECDLVVSGCKAKYHPWFNIVERQSPLNDEVQLVLSLYDLGSEITSRQQCSEMYDLDTTVWIYSRGAIDKGKRIPERTRLYLVPRERSASIDTLLDWRIAEFLYRRNNG